jgi:hypothetical protein
MGFSHFHGSFSNPSPFKGEVRRGMGYICRCSTNLISNFNPKKSDKPEMGKLFGKSSRRTFIRNTTHLSISNSNSPTMKSFLSLKMSNQPPSEDFMDGLSISGLHP